jgi:hypothetical protein
MRVFIGLDGYSGKAPGADGMTQRGQPSWVNLQPEIRRSVVFIGRARIPAKRN